MTRKRLIRLGAILAFTGIPALVLQLNPGKAPMASAAAPPAALASDSAAPTPVTPASESPPPRQVLAPAAPPCHVDMALLTQPGAMLDIGLLAPCRAGQRVTLRHAGLVVTGRVSPAGTMIASLPAFTAPAEVKLTFPDGETVSQTVLPEDLSRYDRFGVQWMAGDAFSLHALAPGAAYESPGHISSTNPGKAGEAGNFLSVLGDPSADRPLMAEVYTWPADTRATESPVSLSLEAAVTPQSCGREMPGETLQLTAGSLAVRELSIGMPDCAAVGEFLVLPNPVSTQTVSSN